MVFPKQMCQFCLISMLRRTSTIAVCVRPILVNSRCEFSSKKGEKPEQTVRIEGQNNFVTHLLNTSIAAHLRRQQKILNYLQEEEEAESNRSKQNRSQKQSHPNQNWSPASKSQKNFDYKSSGEKCSTKKKTSQSTNSNRKIRDCESGLHNSRGRIKEDNAESDLDDYGIDQLETPNWNKMNLTEINKVIYSKSKETQSRNGNEIRTKMQINMNSNAPEPILTFDELNNLSAHTIDALQKENFVNCTPVQSQAIPIALCGSNLLAISNSGTGKMLAMILSAIIHISNQPAVRTEDGPNAMILASTPEIAEEIRQLANTFCSAAHIKCSLLNKKGITTDAASRWLVIATPDYLYEMLRSKSISLTRCSHFALYEADKMIEWCMDEEIVQIASQIRPECQRIIWSTIWNSDINEMAINFLDEHVRFNVGSMAIRVEIAQNVKQIIKVSDEQKKKHILNEIVGTIKSQIADKKTLIFVKNPKKADQIVNNLLKWGCKSQSLHNAKSEQQKNEILLTFDNQETEFLVLTDLAAKNLHFTNISNVIHFDMPIAITDYAHRVNRTGRTDGHGISYAIVTEDNGHLACDLIEILQQTNQSIDPALFLLKAANADSDDEISFAIPDGKGFKRYKIDQTLKD